MFNRGWRSLEGGVYFTSPFSNAAFIGGRRLKEEIRYSFCQKVSFHKKQNIDLNFIDPVSFMEVKCYMKAKKEQKCSICHHHVLTKLVEPILQFVLNKNVVGFVTFYFALCLRSVYSIIVRTDEMLLTYDLRIRNSEPHFHSVSCYKKHILGLKWKLLFFYKWELNVMAAFS